MQITVRQIESQAAEPRPGSRGSKGSKGSKGSTGSAGSSRSAESVGGAARSRSGWVARGAASASPPRLRPVERRVDAGVCPVCTCDEVHFDEVEFGRSMKLAECPRCDHRWTTPVATTRLAPAPRRMVAVPASSVDAAAQA